MDYVKFLKAYDEQVYKELQAVAEKIRDKKDRERKMEELCRDYYDGHISDDNELFDNYLT